MKNKLANKNVNTGQWPWKLESAKKYVTTPLPNQLVLKADGAGALRLHLAVAGSQWHGPSQTNRRALGEP